MGRWSKLRIKPNSAQFKLNLPVGAELGKITNQMVTPAGDLFSTNSTGGIFWGSDLIGGEKRRVLSFN